MKKISISELEKSCLVAAVQGYAASGMQPKEASKQAVELVRCLNKELSQNGEDTVINSLNKIQQLEQKIGRKLEKDERYHVDTALDNGISIDELLVKNPKLFTINAN